MPEPITTVGMGAVIAYWSKDGLAKLLGPTAEYLGEGLRDFTKLGMTNLNRIFTRASEKLGEKIESPGEVPPKVLKEILNEGPFCSDLLASEYLSGVLASSRTDVGRDDRGARIAKTVGGLSTYQIRMHYSLYSTIRYLYKNESLPFNMEGRPKMQSYLPFFGYLQSMDFSPAELNQFGSIINHTFFGLASEDLIDSSNWKYAPKDHLDKEYSSLPDGGIICGPSALGAEVFLWAFGHADKPLEFIFDDAFNPKTDGIIVPIPGALPVSKLTRA